MFYQKGSEAVDDLKKEAQALRYNQSGSNLNSFAMQSDNTNHLLIILQGFQMLTSKSNIVLFAAGGIVIN